MKRFMKMAMVAMLLAPMFYACESLNGELDDVAPTSSEIFMKEGGGEDGGDVDPDGKPGS